MLGALACLLASCERTQTAKTRQQPSGRLTDVRRISNVRTTATRTRKEAAAATPSARRFPAKRHERGRRLVAFSARDAIPHRRTRRNCYVIDDYGSALVGTNTIDLYKTNRLAMRRWGVRRVDIDILEWGSKQQSLKVLAPRAKTSDSSGA